MVVGSGARRWIDVTWTMAPLPRVTIPGMIARSSRTAANRFASRRRLPVLVGERGRAAFVLTRPADVVHQDVDATEPVKRLGAERGNAGGGAHVGGDDVVGRSVRHGPRRHHDPRSTGTQPVRDALADASGATCDQRGPAREFVSVSHAASLAPATDKSRRLCVDDVLRVQHFGVAQLLGDPEPVDQKLRVGPQGAAALVDAAGDGLGALGRQEAVLDEPGLVVLHHRQRVQVTHQPQDLARLLVLAGVDACDEGL